MSENTINKSTINENHLSKNSVFLREATLDDIDALEQLVNCCYRETAGWTNEADLIGGIRTQSLLFCLSKNDHGRP